MDAQAYFNVVMSDIKVQAKTDKFFNDIATNSRGLNFKLGSEVRLDVKILDYDDWCNTLTDEYMQTVEDEDLDLMDLYEDYVSIAQDRAYDEMKDERLMEKN